MKNVILKIISLYYYIYNHLIMARKKVNYDSFPRINGIIRIHGNGRLHIGKDARINSSEVSNPIGGMTHTMFCVYGDSEIIIGNNVGLSNCAIVCKGSVIIEDDVRIGGNVKIYDTDFHSLDYNERINNGNDVGNSKPVVIKKGAFIGAHTIILKGVTVGEKSIVGAGSVITKSIPDKEIWGGNPAIFIKRYEY